MQCYNIFDTTDVLIFHNGIGYDFPLLEKLYGYHYKGKIIDTLLMSRLQNPKRTVPYNCPNKKAGPHSVEAWGYRVGRGKPEHHDWENYSDAMLHRCTEDVEIQCLIYAALLKEGKGYNWSGAHRLTHKLFEILNKQMQYGWMFDTPYAKSRIHMLEHWIARIDKVLDSYLPMRVEIKETKKDGEYNWVRKPFLKSGKPSQPSLDWLGNDCDYLVGPFARVCFRPVNLASNAETKEFLLEEGWQPQEWNLNPDGTQRSPKMSKNEKFEGINGKVGKLIAKRVQASHRKSTLEGWLKQVRPDGRIPAVVTGMAATGRMKHGIVVNVPNVDSFFGRQMRACFTCPEDKVLVGCDSKSCQDRMLANRAGVDEFKDMLLNGNKSKGTDGHSLAMKAVNKAHDMFGLPHVIRGKAKNYNFAFKFGASDNKLGQMSNASKAVGEVIRACLREVFHAQAELVDRLTEEWRKNAKVRINKWGKPEYYNGWCTGLDGRPIFIESEHAILVYMLQSDEAICMSAAYCMMYKRLIAQGYKWGSDFAIVCFYHDEVTIECNPDIAESVAHIMESCIRDAGLFYGITYCKQDGEAEIGRNWAEIH